MNAGNLSPNEFIVKLLRNEIPLNVEVNNNGNGIYIFNDLDIIKLSDTEDVFENSEDIMRDYNTSYGENIVFTINNDELYVVFSYESEFGKEETNFEKSVGLDINFKHALFVTSELDNDQFDGYINLYKYILSHSEFTNLLTEDERKDYEELSRVVTFCPFENQLLFARYDKMSKFCKKEQVLSKLLYSLQKKLKNENRTKEYIYVSCVNKLRAKYISYFILKEKYDEKNKEYDIEMGFVDESTESKENMDKRRFENPFRNTLVANELLAKMSKVQQDINGCMSNIINYVYKVFEQNGYNIIALEKKSFPSEDHIVYVFNLDKVQTLEKVESQEKE